LDELKSELDNLKQQLESIKRDLQQRKSAIDSIEQQTQAGVEIDETNYKRAIREHNDLVRQYNQLLVTGRQKAKEHDALVDDVNAKVRQYNRAIAGQ
jgi:hypothetical protein